MILSWPLGFSLLSLTRASYYTRFCDNRSCTYLLLSDWKPWGARAVVVTKRQLLKSYLLDERRTGEMVSVLDWI